MGGGFQPPYAVIGAGDDDGNPVAACVLNCMNDYGDIEITLVGKGKFTRGLWGVIIAYTWGVLKRTRVTMRFRESNIPAIKLAIHFGAKAEGRLRKYYGTEDAIVFGLLKDEAKHVKPI